MNTRLLRVQILHKIVIYATADEAIGGSVYVLQMFFVFCFFFVFLFFSVRKKYEATVLGNG